MAMLDIKGVHIVRAKGKTYVYAWRGGPRVHAQPGTPEFVEELAELQAKARKNSDRTRFGWLIAAYKASDDWKVLADKSRANWTPFLDSLMVRFGNLPIQAFDRPLIRVAIKKWRDGYKATPRTADMALQCLSRVLSFGVDLGKLQANACTGIARIYSSDRSAIIWTPDDLKKLKDVASNEVYWAAALGALTGLRKSDLLRLTWNHVGPLAIEITTGKSKHRKTTLIPMYRELRQLLDQIPRRSAVTVLTTTEGHSWKTGFGASFTKAKAKSGVDKHFHDLRGTAATRMYLGGLTLRELSEMFTWSEAYVERLINIYVKKDELLLDRIRRMDEAEARTEAVKPAVKPAQGKP
jgi:integrase